MGRLPYTHETLHSKNQLLSLSKAHQITIAEKSRLMSRLIPLLFLDGRVYFATVGAISAVRERDRSVVLTHKINLAHSMNSGNSGSSSNAVMATPTSILSLPPNLSFSDFVAKWAPNFAVLYGEPQILNNGSGHAGKSSCATTGMGANAGVGNLRFCKVAVNPDAVVGIYPEDGWCTGKKKKKRKEWVIVCL